MAIETESIVKNYLILCEGKDALMFLVRYLNSEPLSHDPRFSNETQVMDFGGVCDLTAYLRILMNREGFDEVRSILILRDAETDARRAEREVRRSPEACALPTPEGCCAWACEEGLSVAYALFPKCSVVPVDGALEDLCWEILADPENADLRGETQAFIDCVRKKHQDRIVSHEHKCRLHAFFSTSDRFVSLKIGEAANAGAFNWTSERLSPLKEVKAAGFWAA